MILGHANLVDDTLRTAIYSFHMPLFFVISGYLFKYRDLKEQIAKSWKGIMVPYLLINIICFAIDFQSTFRHSEISMTYLWDRLFPIGIGLGYDVGTLKPVCTPMWFFYIMFYLQIVINVVGRKFKHCLIFTIVSLALCVLMNYKGVNTLVPIDSLLMAVPFFYLGILLKTSMHKVKNANGIIKATLPLFLFPFGLMIGIYNGRIDMDLFEFGKSIFLFYTSAMMICWTLLFVALHVGGNKVVQIISVGSPVIVGFNLTTTSIMLLVNKLFPNLVYNNLIGIAVSLASLCFLILISFLVQKYLPAMLGYRKTR